MASFRLKTRLNMISFGILIIVSISVVFIINYFQRQNAFATAEEKSLILLKHNLAIHTYINNKLKPKLFALTDTIRDPNYFEPVWMSSTYAVREIDRLYRKDIGDNYYYKEAAINARSPENEADKFERDFILGLNKDKKFNKISGIRYFDNKPYFFTLIRGESMEKGCLRCHSTPDKAPGNLVKTYGDARSFNRSLDETVSAISIRVPLEHAFSDANELSVKLSVALLILLISTFYLNNRLISKLVLLPLKKSGLRQNRYPIILNILALLSNLSIPRK